MADRPAEAIERHRPAPSPSRVDAPGHVTAGDIVVVGSMDGDPPRRTVIALDVDEARRCFLGALVTAELPMATADDVTLHTADTGLPYSIVAMTQLAGHLWFAQAEARIGRLTEEALAAVRAGHAWAENDFQRDRRGVPLQDASRDLRWPDLEAEVRQIQELTMHCTLRRRESDWAGPDGELGRWIVEESRKTLESYRAQPNLVAEHANVELDTASGGYRHRQLFELIQNSADALCPDACDEETGGEATAGGPGRIEVRLTTRYLYCADNGEPIDTDGARALLFSRLGTKRGTNQIGTFGLGFKAVLGISDSPEFFSRSGSFRFDRERSRERIEEVVLDADRYPVLRLSEPIDPAECREQDAVLSQLMDWAVNIVRLPLKNAARDDIPQQMTSFPPEFLLFVPHVGRLTITDGSDGLNRELKLEKVDGDFLLADGAETSQWKLFERSHPLSGDARADRRPGDNRSEVSISWAAPLDRLDRAAGEFWAYLPTRTASLVPGILNAPWKTNEDRQNLLPGRYNEKLIEAGAGLIADALPQLATADDPARHLDALPRRHESGDNDHADRLRRYLFALLHERAILPDQNGEPRRIKDISYPPSQLTQDGGMDLAPFERWAAHLSRPSDWLHHKGLTRTRLATVDRLFQTPDQPGRRVSRAPWASISKWLEALIQNAAPGEEVAASMAAIQTAALIPRDRRTDVDLGAIVLTESGHWCAPDPASLFLPFESSATGGAAEPDSSVHPALAADAETRSALQTLGLKKPSPESRFRLIANHVLANRGLPVTPNQFEESWEEYWKASREVGAAVGLAIIQEHQDWPRRLQLRTLAGSWQPIHSVLMPGDVVPGDGSRDDDVTVDTNFHERDNDLLRGLGVSDGPQADRDLRWEPSYDHYRGKCEVCYRRQPLRRNPQRGYLEFKLTAGVGPLDILTALSDEGRVRYTCAVLGMDACYEPWEMWHSTQSEPSPERYPEKQFESLTLRMVREHGSVQTPGGTVPFASALGSHPDTPAALHALLRHPNAEKIKKAFELADGVPELFGEGDPTPLTDIWPGLREYLPTQQRNIRLVPCERIRVAGRERNCVFHVPDVYLAGSVDDDELDSLRLVASELALGLTESQLEAIAQHRTTAQIEARRAEIRRCATDAERLLAAVGEAVLRAGVPASLLEVLDGEHEQLSGIDLAEAAIATYHTDALRHFRLDLDYLSPPTKWARSPRAVAFVHSLGFSDEWAGDRRSRRSPFVEVEGPRSLPELHNYQRTVATNVREMLRSDSVGGVQRRGMVSMPTGSGKTRVAVQAIVEAMRDDGFRGGVLWVADRDELCEQAVEAWEQVWRSEGTEAERIRISRLWEGQARPLPASERHIVVATIQTLKARLSNSPAEYEFLKDFKLAVFDEAHRSIAPSFTSVMQEIGLTYRQREDEPFLLGLTATPYRGHDAAETARLVRRYGSTRLDSGAFADDDPQAVIGELQVMGVLAKAEHKTIDGGTFELDDDELEMMSRFMPGSDESERRFSRAWLPQSAEDRIAQNAARTRRIIEAYETHVEPDWPTLLFATSVEHAQTLAALLNRNGTMARAVSGETDPATRRRVVESFRDGEIKALVNYAVFTEGFDAPKTQAIIVARPVYSPNLYFQMIGRGLRGPLNGGEDRCLILNVEDNIENFSRALAFSELDWLWAR